MIEIGRYDERITHLEVIGDDQNGGRHEHLQHRLAIVLVEFEDNLLDVNARQGRVALVQIL